VKASIKGALRSLAKDENADVIMNTMKEDPVELSKKVSGMVTQPLEAESKHLTGTHGESHQEK
jgi:hypothetical protein